MPRLPEGTITYQLTNMPHYLTSFVGRTAELAALKSSLGKSRMVTLTGAGGSGKTRLAAELGRVYLGLLPGGAWWVDLAQVDDPDQMPGAVVAALQLTGRGPAREVVTAWLAARRALLVLDNCEHLVAACAEFCRSALRRCPELTIIATSREPLGVSGEARCPISSMPAADAVQLFEARAQLVLPNYEVTISNLETVARVCARLDGMPLAIELAAARLGMLTEHEILSQLSDRFRLLSGGDRVVPKRQQTMVATIDWSYRLLTDEEALLFRRLSVFRGGFTRESVQAVCADGIAANVLDFLAGLVQKSMVVAERASGTRTRYRLLESQLAYAEDRLRETGEIEPAHRRHYDYFQESLAARTFRPGRPTPGMEEADWMVEESGNLWAAMEWARRNADDLGLSLAVDLGPMAFTQARSLFADLLARSPTQGKVRVRGLVWATSLAVAQGDHEAALQAGESAVALARKVGDVDLLAFALNCLGVVHRVRGEHAAAAELYGEAISLLNGSTNVGQLAAIRNHMGMLAIDTGDYLGASNILAEAVAIARAEGDDMAIASDLDSLARAQLALNDHRAAAESWKEAISIKRRLDPFNTVIDCIAGMASIACARADDHRTLRLSACASRLSGEWSVQLDPWIRRRVEAAQRRSRARLGTVKSEDAWKAGWAMSLDQAIDYALGEGESETLVDGGPLSLREREVAKLIAAGITNRQIAKQLFISERTAESHVEHIRNKLGVRSRSEIATWAVRCGLAKTGPQTN